MGLHGGVLDEVNKCRAVLSPLLTLHAVVVNFSLTPDPPRRFKDCERIFMCENLVLKTKMFHRTQPQYRNCHYLLMY